MSTNNVTTPKNNAVATAFTTADIEIIRTQFAPTISDGDLKYCLTVAESANLNPILGEIYFIPRRSQVNGQWVDKHQPCIGRSVARKIARSKGMKIPPNTGVQIKSVPVLRNGKWIEDTDLVGWAEMVIDGQTVRKEMIFSNYKQTQKSGELSKFWATMPQDMIQKVAEFQLLDAVYGLDGLFSADAGFVEDVAPSEIVEFSPSIEKTLNELGIDFQIANNLVVLIGKKTYENQKTIKGLGFTVQDGKYTMPANSYQGEVTEAEVEPINTAE